MNTDEGYGNANGDWTEEPGHQTDQSGRSDEYFEGGRDCQASLKLNVDRISSYI